MFPIFYLTHIFDLSLKWDIVSWRTVQGTHLYKFCFGLKCFKYLVEKAISRHIFPQNRLVRCFLHFDKVQKCFMFVNWLKLYMAVSIYTLLIKLFITQSFIILMPNKIWGTASHYHSTRKLKCQNSLIYCGIQLWNVQITWKIWVIT